MDFSSGEKRHGREADHSPLSGDELRIKYTEKESYSPYILYVGVRKVAEPILILGVFRS